jgi:hypothetical protein
MKTILRALLLFFAGLSLAGCTSRTAALQEIPRSQAIALNDHPLSTANYWLMRDLDDRIDRALEGSASNSSRR